MINVVCQIIRGVKGGFLQSCEHRIFALRGPHANTWPTHPQYHKLYPGPESAVYCEPNLKRRFVYLKVMRYFFSCNKKSLAINIIC